MRRSRLLLSWHLLAGLLVLVTLAEGLRGTALVINKLKQKTSEAAGTVAERRSTDEEAAGSSTENGGNSVSPSAPATEVNATTKSPLTGIPQVDYLRDPNLPRELNGYNLTEYPFFDRVPEEIDFKCDGLHDGFYASILHKCQVYHHCLFGTRYDFLCANYTAFDQKTFICHFASEVDCINSPKYFKRNEALYKEASTTTIATTTTTATQPPPPARRPQPATRPGGRRRPSRPRRPEYDYYYDDDYEDDLEYYDDELPAHRSTTAGNGRRRKHRRPQRPVEDDRRRPASASSEPLDQVDPQQEADSKSRPSASVYDRPRTPPKIRRPVPLNERDKYDYTTRKPPSGGTSASEEPIEDTYSRPRPQARPLVHQDDDYYDDEDEYIPPARNSQSSSRGKTPDYYSPTASDDRDINRRPTMTGAGRPLRRNRPTGSSRRRPAETATQYAPLPLDDESDDYDQSYDQEPRRPVRPVNGRRKRPQQGSGRQEDYYRPTAQSARQDPEYSQQQRPAQRGRYDEEKVDDPVPAPRPAYISTAPGGSSTRQVNRKRVQQQPEAAADEYEPPRSQASESTAYRRPGQRKHAAPARQPTTYSEEPSEETDYYDDEELPEQDYRNRQTQSQRGSQVAAGPYKQPVNPIPPLPPTKSSTNVEDDDIIVPPQRSGNGKRPFLPSRGGNPTLPRGLQPLGTKAPQQTPKAGSSNDDSTEDKQSRVPQPLTASNYRPKAEDDYEEEDPPRRTLTKTGSSADLSDALTSRPISQSSYKSGGRRDPQIDSLEEELPRRVQSGNSEYQSKLVEDIQPRIPPSAAGNFRTKQTTSANVGDTASRNTNFNNGKYRPNSQETVQGNPPLSVTGPSSSNYRARGDDISLSTAKTSSPLQNVRGDGNSNRQQSSQPLKTFPLVTEDVRPVPPSATVYRTPAVKPSVVPPPRVPDLPARTNLADIDESEYDVTLNDALHPTLHPTRSVATGIVSFPQPPLQRVQVFKTKIGSSSSSPLSSSSSLRGVEALSNDPSSSSTGGRGYLVGSASQRHVTRAPYASLSVHDKDPGLVVVDTNTRDGQLAYLQQQGDTVQYNTQQARKRRPVTQYDDEVPSHDVGPPRFTQVDPQYQRGVPLLVADDISYSNERQRQSWSQQQRKEPNVGYATQY